MQNDTILIFGYGSLMSETSHTKTVGPKHKDLGFYTLNGFERIFNACYGGNVYLNIRQHPSKNVIGNLIEITRSGYDALRDREAGYEFIDISSHLDFETNRPVYTCYISDGTEISGTIKQSYINKCLVDLPEQYHTNWLAESIILTPIEKDEDPL